MRLLIAAVGRARTRAEQALVAAYAARMTAWPLAVRELQARGRPPGPARRGAEAALLLGAVPAGAAVVALDGAGRDLTSAELADRLRRWHEEGIADAAFLVGGADGLDDRVRSRADLVLAFGRQTWPHMLVRVMLAEQLYRAQSIVAGHPYHRG